MYEETCVTHESVIFDNNSNLVGIPVFRRCTSFLDLRLSPLPFLIGVGTERCLFESFVLPAIDSRNPDNVVDKRDVKRDLREVLSLSGINRVLLPSTVTDRLF